jgi:hypothetical protein
MNKFTQYFNNLGSVFSRKAVISNDLSKKTSSYNPTIQKDITAIIDKYIKKEKAYNNNNLESKNFDMLVLEKDLQERYNKNKSNNFSFPEIKNVLDCIADVLTYFKDIPYYKSDNRMRWQIDQIINLIKNASQETVCADIKFDKCPPEDTISTIKNANNKGYFNIKNENVIFRHGKEYCDDNVYETPYNGNQYPYAYSIRVMVQAICLIDLINIELKNKKQGGVWNSHYATVYFGERYHYYLDYLLDNAPDVFILPILQNVGATTLIRNRYSRIQPCGIIFDEAFVDEDMQTPSNFFWHDVQELMPIKDWLSSNPENMKYESLIKILLFEVVHEDALPFTKDSIKMDILFSSGNCYPYERTYDNVEEGNPYNRINLRFYEQGASTLRTIYNKVRHTFFEKEKANDIIVKTELRYIKHMVEASYLLLKKVSPNEYNENTKEAVYEQLKQLIRDKTFQAHNAKRLHGVNTDSQDRSGHSNSSRRRNKV